jgi:hypothetical protein
MKRHILILAACACACASAGVMSARIGALGRNDTVVTNVTDITPGNYETVSNRAMSAVQSLIPAYEYADAALGSFAATGTVARATTYGTPTRWTDATGCVWQVWRDAGWSLSSYLGFTPEEISSWVGPYWHGADEEMYSDDGWYLEPGGTPTYLSGDPNATTLHFDMGDQYLADWSRYDNLVTNLVGRVALTNDIPDVSGYTTQLQSTNAAIAVADAKISTNNEAFVSAVLAVPIAGADAGDLAEIAEYGGYGTVGAAILALIAGLAALKRRVTSAETALAQKADATDLPYALVTPGKWEFSGVPSGVTVVDLSFDTNIGWLLSLSSDPGLPLAADGTADDLIVSFQGGITATRASLPGHLCDRAGNRVEVSGDTTLTLPAAVPGYLRDFLVRLEISGSTVPTITFAAPTGETITYETDGDEFPVPDEVGNWVYSFTENCVAHKFAVSLKKVNEVAAPQAQGGS